MGALPQGAAVSLSDFQEIFQSDLAFALGEVGSRVVYGAFTTGGILLHEPTDILQMGLKQYAVSDTELTLTIATGSIGVITNATPITIDGALYQIHKFILVNDGLETKLWVSVSEGA